jgi:putative FmdB family regulatory protein
VPTYEYQCDKCGRVFEVRQRISAAPLTTCDACGGQVRRLIAAAPFILKGKGWYVTDYPSDARKKALESEKSAPGGDSKKSDTDGKKSDTDGKKSEKKDAAAAKVTADAPAPSSAPSTSTPKSSGSSSD